MTARIFLNLKENIGFSNFLSCRSWTTLRLAAEALACRRRFCWRKFKLIIWIRFPNPRIRIFLIIFWFNTIFNQFLRYEKMLCLLTKLIDLLYVFKLKRFFFALSWLWESGCDAFWSLFFLVWNVGNIFFIRKFFG